MTFAYFLDALTDRTPKEVPKNIVLIGEISNIQRQEWRVNGRVLGMSRDRVRNLERDGLAGLRRISDQVEAYVAA